jgi:hypothetical protein
VNRLLAATYLPFDTTICFLHNTAALCFGLLFGPSQGTRAHKNLYFFCDKVFMPQPDEGSNKGPKHAAMLQKKKSVMLNGIFDSLFILHTQWDDSHQINQSVTSRTRKPGHTKKGNLRMNLREICFVYFPIFNETACTLKKCTASTDWMVLICYSVHFCSLNNFIANKCTSFILFSSVTYNLARL